jgi:5-methylcytosine-specific restriction endonuclease McrA
VASTNGVHSAKHKTLARNLALKRLPCWLCGQPIDYELPHTHPMHYQYDHAFPRSTHPELEFDPSNGRPSHARCNKSRGNGPPNPGVGETSEPW